MGRRLQRAGAPRCSQIHAIGHEVALFSPPLRRLSSWSRINPKPVLDPHLRLKTAQALPGAQGSFHCCSEPPCRALCL